MRRPAFRLRFAARRRLTFWLMRNRADSARLRINQNVSRRRAANRRP